MSVDGWSELGSKRFLCLEPGEDMIANSFLGYPWSINQPPSPSIPSISIGASDFSMEVWARRRFGNSPGADEQFWTGILENNPATDFPAPIAAIRYQNTSDSVSVFFDALGVGAPAAITVAGAPTRLGLWSHYVVNFDRDANMELFIDAKSKATASIAAQPDAIVGEVHPLTADHAFEFHAADYTTLNNISIFTVMVGPFAIHKRLLTASEIESSFRNKTVQSLGASGTWIRFDWRKFQGETGWDVDYERAMFGHLVGLPVPAGAPLGENGTVTVRDSSGNDNHWTLPTATDYSTWSAPVYTIESGHWPIAFGAEAGFR